MDSLIRSQIVGLSYFWTSHILLKERDEDIFAFAFPNVSPKEALQLFEKNLHYEHLEKFVILYKLSHLHFSSSRLNVVWQVFSPSKRSHLKTEDAAPIVM